MVKAWPYIKMLILKTKTLKWKIFIFAVSCIFFSSSKTPDKYLFSSCFFPAEVEKPSFFEHSKRKRFLLLKLKTPKCGNTNTTSDSICEPIYNTAAYNRKIYMIYGTFYSVFYIQTWVLAEIFPMLHQQNIQQDSQNKRKGLLCWLPISHVELPARPNLPVQNLSNPNQSESTGIHKLLQCTTTSSDWDWTHTALL